MVFGARAGSEHERAEQRHRDDRQAHEHGARLGRESRHLDAECGEKESRERARSFHAASVARVTYANSPRPTNHAKARR